MPGSVKAQDATLADTRRVLEDLLEIARYDVERFQGTGSDLDMAEAHVKELLLALDGVTNALHAD